MGLSVMTFTSVPWQHVMVQK